MSILLLETEVFFPVSILVRKPMQIKWFPHFLRFGEESEKNCSKVTVTRPSGSQCPKEKEDAIVEALKHFQMI